MPGKGLLDHIGIDPSCYEIEYFKGDPKMLIFEAQRVLRNRLGGYDFYGVIEDDIAIYDPTFFRKLSWFEESFGPSALLKPTRYELLKSGIPVSVIIDPDLRDDLLTPFRRPGQRRLLRDTWQRKEQTFILPKNPHSACFFVSDVQLREWIKSPFFYDLNASWVGPLESATNLSLGLTFDLYKGAFPDPFFLSVEHFGARYAGANIGDGYNVISNVLNRVGTQSNPAEILDFVRSEVESIVAQRNMAIGQLESFKNSRSKLFRALCKQVARKSFLRRSS